MKDPKHGVSLWLGPADMAAVDGALDLYNGANRHLIMLALLRLGAAALREDPAAALAVVQDQRSAQRVTVREGGQ